MCTDAFVSTFFRRFLQSVFARNIFLHQCHLRPGVGKGWGVHLSPPPIPGSPLNTLLGRKTRLTRLPGHTRPQFGIISCFLIRTSTYYCISVPAVPKRQVVKQPYEHTLVPASRNILLVLMSPPTWSGEGRRVHIPPLPTPCSPLNARLRQKNATGPDRLHTPEISLHSNEEVAFLGSYWYG